MPLILCRLMEQDMLQGCCLVSGHCQSHPAGLKPSMQEGGHISVCHCVLQGLGQQALLLTPKLPHPPLPSQDRPSCRLRPQQLLRPQVCLGQLAPGAAVARSPLSLQASVAPLAPRMPGLCCCCAPTMWHAAVPAWVPAVTGQPWQSSVGLGKSRRGVLLLCQGALLQRMMSCEQHRSSWQPPVM